jgi:hypothetical protein
MKFVLKCSVGSAPCNSMAATAMTGPADPSMEMCRGVYKQYRRYARAFFSNATDLTDERVRIAKRQLYMAVVLGAEGVSGEEPAVESGGCP